jgi:hypothetical protein
MSNSKSTKNALSHGAYSSDVILPWENASDFNELYQELREELFASGRSEEEAVAELACLHWKKRRLNVAFQLAARRDAHFSKLVDAGQREGWNGIIDYIANASDDRNASIRELNKLYVEAAKRTYAFMSKETEQLMAADAANQKGEQTTDKLAALIRMLKELQVSGAPIGCLLRMIENGQLDQERWHSPYKAEVLEKELKIAGEIDKRIEKVMRRLVEIKEYKRLYRAREIEALPSAATVLPAKPKQIQ